MSMIGAFVHSALASLYKIDRSLRCSAASSSYLSRTFGTPTSLNIFTLSLWVKRGKTGSLQVIFGENAGNGYWLEFNASDLLRLVFNGGQVAISTVAFKDPTAFYHIVWTCNGTTQTIYANGVQVATGTGTNNRINSAILTALFGFTASFTNTVDGQLAEARFIDGQELPPNNFAETSLLIGQWTAKNYTGSYGNNGFYLDFKDGTSTTTLGYDKSGNNNHWTLNNFTRSAGVNDCWMLDVPATNPNSTVGSSNFCILDPLDKGTSFTIAEGNLAATIGGTWNTVRGSFGITSGKWYWEIINSGATATIFGIAGVVTPLNTNLGTVATDYGYQSNGTKWNNNSSPAYGATYTTNDIIGVLFDATAGTIEFFKNNVSQGVAFTGIPAGTYFPAVSVNGGTARANFGQRSLAYSVPSGASLLNTANITSTDVIESGSFTGNTSTDGPKIWTNGALETLTINGNAVTWGTHALKIANGFKLITTSTSYNSTGTNTWTGTVLSPESKSAFKNQTAKAN